MAASSPTFKKLPVFSAAESLNFKKLKELLNATTIRQKNDYQETVLHWMLKNVFNGHHQKPDLLKCLRLILEVNDQNKNQPNSNIINDKCIKEHSALWYAINNGFNDCAELLIDKGAVLENLEGSSKDVLPLATTIADQIPSVLIERFNKAITMDMQTGSIILDWKPILQYNEIDNGITKYFKPGKDQKETTFLCRILDGKNSKDRQELLTHVLVSSFLHLKYKSAYPLIMSFFIIAVLFQLIYIGFVYYVYFESCKFEVRNYWTDKTVENSWATFHPNHRHYCKISFRVTMWAIAMSVYAILWLIKMLLLIYKLGPQYLKDWRTWVTASYLGIVGVTLYPAFVSLEEITFQYPTAALGLFFACIMFLHQFSNLPHNWGWTSTAWMDFTKGCSLWMDVLAMILWTVFKIYMLFMPLLIAYYMGFWLLLHKKGMFRFIMMTADVGSNISYADLNTITEEADWWYKLVTYTFCTSFIIIIVTVFVNFVIGVSTENIRELKQMAEISFTEKTIHELFSIELLDIFGFCNLVPLKNSQAVSVKKEIQWKSDELPKEIWAQMIELAKSNAGKKSDS